VAFRSLWIELELEPVALETMAEALALFDALEEQEEKKKPVKHSKKKQACQLACVVCMPLDLRTDCSGIGGWMAWKSHKL